MLFNAEARTEPSEKIGKERGTTCENRMRSGRSNKDYNLRRGNGRRACKRPSKQGIDNSARMRAENATKRKRPVMCSRRPKTPFLSHARAHARTRTHAHTHTYTPPKEMIQDSCTYRSKTGDIGGKKGKSRHRANSWSLCVGWWSFVRAKDARSGMGLERTEPCALLEGIATSTGSRGQERSTDHGCRRMSRKGPSRACLPIAGKTGQVSVRHQAMQVDPGMPSLPWSTGRPDVTAEQGHQSCDLNGLV